VNVQVVDCLATVGSSIHNQSKAIGKLLILDYFPGGVKKTSESRLIAEFSHVSDMMLGHHQDVGRSLRIDVANRYIVIAFADNFGRNFFGCDFAKKAIGVFFHSRKPPFSCNQSIVLFVLLIRIASGNLGSQKHV
jgi:hypothetical protein